EQLKRARLDRRWSQKEAAERLGVSQSYLAMLESGKRHFVSHLARRARRVYKLPPTVLPPGELRLDRQGTNASQAFAEQVAALWYPGFSYLKPRRRQRNPSAVLLEALAQKDLEARVVESLPWLLVRYADMNADWLLQQSKLHGLQNRLGFVTTLARQVLE